MKKQAISALLLLSLIGSFIAIPAFADDDDTFTKYLQKGDRDGQVVELQKILNDDEATEVASEGSGSKGQETDFFGELTKQAVIKLQKKYSLGTKYGFFTIYSGALDDKTRDFLNDLDKKKDPCKRDYDRTNFNSVMQHQQKVIELSEKLRSGTSQDSWKDLNSLFREKSAASSSAPYINKIEVSAKDDNDDFGPLMESKFFSDGDEMRIYGCNFATSTDNTIRMTYGNEKATSTDGTLIILELDSKIQQMFDKQTDGFDSDQLSNTIGKMPEIPVFITVQNDNGISNPYYLYTKIE